MATKDSLKNLTVQLLWDAGYISGSVLSPQPQNMDQLIQFIEAFPAEQPIAMDQIPETFESALFHLAGFDGPPSTWQKNILPQNCYLVRV